MGIDKNRRRVSDAALRPVCIRVQAGILTNTDGNFTLPMVKIPTKSIIESASVVSSSAMTGSLEAFIFSLYNTTQGETLGTLSVSCPANDFTANTPKALTMGTGNLIVESGDVIDFIAAKSAGTNSKLIAAEITIQVNHRPV